MKNKESEEIKSSTKIGDIFAALRRIDPMFCQGTFAWFKDAAEKGDAAAQYNLGLMYDQGEGVQQDYDSARAWFEKAAEQGLAAAQYNLGVMYLQGEGVQQDYDSARAWFEKAAEQGLADAQYQLGVMYPQGEGVQMSVQELSKQ